MTVCPHLWGSHACHRPAGHGPVHVCLAVTADGRDACSIFDSDTRRAWYNSADDGEPAQWGAPLPQEGHGPAVIFESGGVCISHRLLRELFGC